MDNQDETQVLAQAVDEKGFELLVPLDKGEVGGRLLPDQILVLTNRVDLAKLDHNPAAVYLATLRPTGRRSMQHYLDVMAEMVQPGATALTLPWGELRYQHTAAIRSFLQDHYKAASANTALAALRRVLGCVRNGTTSKWRGQKIRPRANFILTIRPLKIRVSFVQISF